MNTNLACGPDCAVRWAAAIVPKRSSRADREAMYEHSTDSGPDDEPDHELVDDSASHAPATIRPKGTHH